MLASIRPVFLAWITSTVLENLRQAQESADGPASVMTLIIRLTREDTRRSMTLVTGIAQAIGEAIGTIQRGQIVAMAAGGTPQAPAAPSTRSGGPTRFRAR
jgi:hypothetical protein